jgi:3-dehydroquinate dehydratase-2
MRILIVNGPNLNLLGTRQPEVYGNQTFESFFEDLKAKFSDHELVYFQSNHEGDLIDFLQKESPTAHGIIINAGGLTHTSVSLADALANITLPKIEVHISNISAREEFRKISHVSAKAKGTITGLGLHGYVLALDYLLAKSKGTITGL